MSQTLKNQKHPFPGATLHWPETMLRNSKQKKMQPLWQQWSVWITITLVSVWKSERLCVSMNRRERERDLSDSSIWFTWNEMRESNGKVSFGEMREGKSRVNYMRCANEALEKSFIKITMLLFILFLSFLAKNKMKSEILEQQQFSLPIFFKCIN